MRITGIAATHTCALSVGCPYGIEPLAMVTCKRVVYGFSTGFLQFRDDVLAKGSQVPIRLLYGYRTVTVRLPYGACTGPYGTCASTVRTCTCLRTPVELYDNCTWPVRVQVMAVSAHTGSWSRTTAYVPSTGKERCACTTFRHGLLTGIRGLSIRAEKNPVELRAGPCGMPYDHPRLTGIVALKVPVDYPGAPCDLGISTELNIHSVCIDT